MTPAGSPRTCCRSPKVWRRRASGRCCPLHSAGGGAGVHGRCPPVLALWPPQRELLSRATQNPLDPMTGRLLLSVPTSAGKTLLAQVMICTHLATHAGDVCHVTPLRSLGREMRQALGSRLRVLRRELGIDVPDFATASTGAQLVFRFVAAADERRSLGRSA